MNLPDESKDLIGKSQEIWNWLVLGGSIPDFLVEFE